MLTLLLMLFSFATAQEDSKPIHLQFYDAGVPQWLDKESILEHLKSKGSTPDQDPLLERLIHYSNQQPFTDAQLQSTSFDLEQAIHQASFIHQKSFNCYGAALKLNQIKALQGGGKVIFLRGSRRVLIAHVGVTSFCLQASSFDGRRLNNARLQRLYDQLFDSYINSTLEEEYIMNE